MCIHFAFVKYKIMINRRLVAAFYDDLIAIGCEIVNRSFVYSALIKTKIPCAIVPSRGFKMIRASSGPDLQLLLYNAAGCNMCTILNREQIHAVGVCTAFEVDAQTFLVVAVIALEDDTSHEVVYGNDECFSAIGSEDVNGHVATGWVGEVVHIRTLIFKCRHRAFVESVIGT